MRFSTMARATLLVPVLLVTASSWVDPSRAEEDCLRQAWGKFNAAAFDSAMVFADRCIDEFGRAAEKTQAKLTEEKVPLPPTGAVSAADKQKIFARGLLNDAGTALFVKGRAAEKLYAKGGGKDSTLKTVATAAYKGACRLPHARTWDPKGWFWSPCEAATERLPVK